MEEEKIIEIEVERLKEFEGHPFKVKEDQEMQSLMESISKFGILNPVIVRPVPEGKYEIISGHRRKCAAEKLGYRKVPVIIRVMTDDEAVIAMVDSNLQREKITISEKAFAYKMKYDALRSWERGKPRTTTPASMRGIKTVAIVGKEGGDSAKQVSRFLKITSLHPKLLERLDNDMLGLYPAYEIAFLTMEEQEMFLDVMDYLQCTPSHAQALHLKELSSKKELNRENMIEIMDDNKSEHFSRISFRSRQIKKYFPKNYTNEQIKEEIIRLLEMWADLRGVDNKKTKKDKQEK